MLLTEGFQLDWMVIGGWMNNVEQIIYLIMRDLDAGNGSINSYANGSTLAQSHRVFPYYNSNFFANHAMVQTISMYLSDIISLLNEMMRSMQFISWFMEEYGIHSTLR